MAADRVTDVFPRMGSDLLDLLAGQETGLLILAELSPPIHPPLDDPRWAHAPC